MRLLTYLHGQLPVFTERPWEIWTPDEPTSHPLPVGQIIAPYRFYEEVGEPPIFGIWFSEDDDVRTLARRNIGVIAVRFPSFKDGRGYTTAALLRERFDWQGPLLAFGDVLLDQLDMLARVGFDHFALRADQQEQHAIAQFYQYTARAQKAWRG